MLTPIALSYEVPTLARRRNLRDPMFTRHLQVPNVVIVPIADKSATWDVFVAWQRGKTTAPVRALLGALDLKPRSTL